MNKSNKIIQTYDVITDMKKKINNGVTEAVDIQGIDELVYNPATKEGGTIGYGYDKGQRKKGITWSGHENHLHIGFTNRETAIAVIDKADSMGLVTTENPYAKKDPNRKVDTGHSSSSFHYKNFPGTPTVGMGVDISGNPSKVTELIKWIESKYSNGVTSSTESGVDDSSSEGGFISSIANNIAKSIMPGDTSINVLSSSGLKENVDRIKELMK
jgi:hypothetical protein